MSYLVYVNVQKTLSGKVYADMHKSDERFYFTKEEAQEALDADPMLSQYRHVVPCVVMTEYEYNVIFKGSNEDSTG